MAPVRTQSVGSIVLAAGILFNPAIASEPTPMDRVITLLTDLRSRIDAEGLAEARTYSKFACFCKDTMADKTKAVSTGETERNSLQSQINGCIVRRESNDNQIAAATAGIAQVQQEMDQDAETTRTQNEEISKGLLDVTKAVHALEAAIGALEAAKTGTALVDVGVVPKQIREALYLVEVLGSTNEAALRVVHGLARSQGLAILVPVDYEFHATDVIATLNGLKVDFVTKKNELLQSQSDLLGARKTFVTDKEKLIGDHETSLVTLRFAKKTETDDLNTASQDLTTIAAQLLDDQVTLSELSAKCTEKARLWDVRTGTRAGELSAITAALAELQGFQVSLPTLLQKEGKAHHAGKSSASASLSEPPTFVQLARSSQLLRHRLGRHLRGHTATEPLAPSSDDDAHPQQGEIVDLLRMKAETLKSALLLKVASEVAEDPFAKVRGLIQDLIERLLKQQADEANHKGWCDKEVSVARTSRDTNADALKAVNSKMEVAEAHREKLTLLVATLNGELVTIGEQLSNSTTLRGEEKAENAKRVQSASEGRDAVVKAIDILEKFYKTAAKQKASSFLQVAPPAPPAPAEVKAGFDDAYTGEQSDKEGVVAMLEVVQSDFERTIAETEKAESISQQDYVELQTTFGQSNATKTVAHKDRDAALTAANAEYAQDQSDMAKHLKGRDEALQQLKALHGPCLASGGTSPEEKKAQREEELAALNQAICILDQHGRDNADAIC